MVGIEAMRIYGKRAKLLAAFSRFAYQKNEIMAMLNSKDYPIKTYRDGIKGKGELTQEHFYKQIVFFIEQIESLEIWKHNEWNVLPMMKDEIDKLKGYLQGDIIEWDIAYRDIIVCWHRLANLNSIYEEVCREWFLPKMIGLLSSYPEAPEIFKVG